MDPVATLVKDALAHPYATYEREIVDYVPNTMSSLGLVSCFAAGCVAMFASTHVIIQQKRPGMGRGDRFIMMWFVMCGFIHFFFEGESQPQSHTMQPWLEVATACTQRNAYTDINTRLLCLQL